MLVFYQPYVHNHRFCKDTTSPCSCNFPDEVVTEGKRLDVINYMSNKLKKRSLIKIDIQNTEHSKKTWPGLRHKP